MVGELYGGLTNRSYLVSYDQQRAVVRINADNSAELGIDRQLEMDIVARLQHCQVSPQQLHSTAQVSVTRFVEGRGWSKKDLRSPDQRQRMAAVIDRYQQVSPPASVTRFCYRPYLQAYADQLSTQTRQQYGQFIDAVLEAAAAVDAQDWQPVLCHHDLNAENIIDSEQGLVVLDWEYANWGHPDIDLLTLRYEVDPPFSVPGQEQLSLIVRGLKELWHLLQKP